MKSLPFRLSAIAVLMLAFAAEAFGGRMIDSGAPPALPEATKPEVTEPDAPAPEDPDDTTPPEDALRISEPAEDREFEMGEARTPALPPRLWNWSVSFTINAFYDDNILISSSQKESDEILRAAADFGFTWGDYVKKKDSFLTVHYAPSWLFFTDHSDLNGFEQEGTIIGQWRTGKFTLGTVLTIETLTGGDIDVGARADRTTNEIELNAKYDYSDKTSFEANFSRSATDYQTYLGSVEWIDRNWVDFQMLPKTRIGIGLTLGDLEPEGGTAQTYEQILGRIAFPASEKLSVTLSGGMEVRQLGNGNGTQTKPVFTLGLNYHPFDGTNISLEASRRVFSSALDAATNYTATLVTASVRQRIRQRFFVTVAGGLEDADYEGLRVDVATSRHDKYVFARPSVSWALKEWADLEIYYKYRRNASTDASLSFTDNIAGVQAAIHF